MRLLASIIMMFAGVILHAGEYYIPEVGRSVRPRMKVIQAFEQAGSDALRTEFFPGGHHCGKDVQRIIIDFLNQNL